MIITNIRPSASARTGAPRRLQTLRRTFSAAVSGSAFTDVDSDVYYANAVAWASAQGITTGATAAAFSPENSCTRGQAVTFLYRPMAQG